jgi:MFS family permease
MRPNEWTHPSEPGLAGLVIAGWGTGQALLMNSLSFVFVLGALLLMRTSELRPAPRLTGRGGVREGFAYVRQRGDLKLIMLLVFVLGTFGMNFQITTALMATQIFDKGAGEYGLLGSIMAIGSLTAALMTARRKTPRLRIFLVALVGFTLASAAAALAPTYVTFAILLVPVGLTALTAMTTANTLVQTRVDPVMRGRVMALYMAIFMGGTPVGAPVIGWIGATWGPRWTILIGSIAVGLAVVAILWRLMALENVKVSYEYQRRPRWKVTTAAERSAGRPAVTETMPEAAR